MSAACWKAKNEGHLICLLVVFDDFVAANAGWLRWVMLAGVVVALSRERRTRAELSEEDRVCIAVVVSESPWLKAWFTAWAIIFFVAAVYVTRGSIDLAEVFGFKFLVIGLLVVMGPVIVLNELQRYNDPGMVTSPDANRELIQNNGEPEVPQFAGAMAIRLALAGIALVLLLGSIAWLVIEELVRK